MVNARFRGVELEESEKSDEAKRQNPTSEAEQELLHSMREAYLAENVNIGEREPKQIFCPLRAERS